MYIYIDTVLNSIKNKAGGGAESGGLSKSADAVAPQTKGQVYLRIRLMSINALASVM